MSHHHMYLGSATDCGAVHNRPRTNSCTVNGVDFTVLTSKSGSKIGHCSEV